MHLSNTIVNQIDNLLPETSHTMATTKLKFRRNSKHASWKNTKKQRQWSPRRNNQRRPEHMDYIFAMQHEDYEAYLDWYVQPERRGHGKLIFDGLDKVWLNPKDNRLFSGENEYYSEKLTTEKY